MARARERRNGRFDEAMNQLILAHAALAQTQAALQTQVAEHDREMAEFRRQFLEIERRFDRIEALLVEHSRILERLPDAIRERMGFAVPERRPTE